MEKHCEEGIHSECVEEVISITFTPYTDGYCSGEHSVACTVQTPNHFGWVRWKGSYSFLQILSITKG